MTFLSQVQSYVFNVKRFTLQIPIYQTLCIRSWRTQTCEYINHAWELKLHFSSEQRWFHDFSLIFSICRLHTSICSCAVIYVQAGHRVSHSSLLWMWFRHRNTCEQCDLPQQLFFLLTLNNHRLLYITLLSVDTKGIEMLVWCGLQLIQYINMCSSPIHCVLIKKTTIYVPCCVMLVLQCWLIVAWVASMILQMKIRSIETEQRGRDVSFEETFKSHTVSLATFP